MKIPALTFAILGGLAIAAPAFEPVDLSERPNTFRISEDTLEIEPKDGRIHRITLSPSGKNFTILFRNEASESYRPAVKFYLLDEYGLPLKWASEFWSFNSIPAGETKTHDANWIVSKVEEQLQFGSVQVPESRKVAWLAIEYER